MRVNQQGNFGMEVAQRRVGGKRNLNHVADTTDVYEHLVRPFVGESPAKLTNHRGSVLPPCCGLSNAATAAIRPPCCGEISRPPHAGVPQQSQPPISRP